jgi:hypothetical protein
MNNIESIIDKVRQLRDADHHVCEYELWQQNGEPDVDKVPTCSCLEYDRVIDALEALRG